MFYWSLVCSFFHLWFVQLALPGFSFTYSYCMMGDTWFWCSAGWHWLGRWWCLDCAFPCVRFSHCSPCSHPWRVVKANALQLRLAGLPLAERSGDPLSAGFGLRYLRRSTKPNCRLRKRPTE
ncbi:hypothetical protein FN846DRAFT_187774 [Sphaerosporella brunnea]|uniref:Secreted protein n=1 Tax=Sphaerosporella brunnea TaxID=1250544 RepID=A0A5J5EQF1_9PEZI|nr:hypothetical protein FN846DRAFT_187774 [Sphaerosporella brunnea]